MIDPPRVKLLLVDDDVAFGEMSRRRLEHLGYEVDFHRGGFGATQKIKTGLYALVLLDFNMPGLSGESLVESWGEGERPATVFYSSASEAELAAVVARLGLAGFISKSASLEELGRRLAELTRGHKPAST